MTDAAHEIGRRTAGLARQQPVLVRVARRHRTAAASLVVLLIMVGIAAAAPWLATDPLAIDPIHRLTLPGGDYWFGTDHLGRDVFSRTLHGGRVSLVVGLSVAVLSGVAGLVIGLISGFLRAVDAVLMRVMDGLMSIPEIMIAVALMAVTSASTRNVVIAVTIPQVPRIARVVRSIVLMAREEPYVEAAKSVGTRVPKLLYRHVLPNTMGPLLVQGTYACANAMIMEALLGFIGAGTPPEIPSWGNIMAEGRVYFEVAPWLIFFPGVFLTLTVLSVNVLGDGLRDMLDPRLSRQL